MYISNIYNNFTRGVGRHRYDTCKTKNMFPWVVGIVPMVTNHGIAPRDILETKSIWSERPISKSDESPGCMEQSRSGGDPELPEPERSGIGGAGPRAELCWSTSESGVEAWE